MPFQRIFIMLFYELCAPEEVLVSHVAVDLDLDARDKTISSSVLPGVRP